MVQDTAEHRAFVGERIKSLRLHQGASATKIAELLSISRPTLYDLEAGRRALLAVELYLLAAYFVVSKEEILGLAPLPAAPPHHQRENMIASELSSLASQAFERVLMRSEKLRADSATVQGRKVIRKVLRRGL